MRRVWICAAVGAAAVWLCADAAESAAIVLDTRTAGAGGMAESAAVDARGLTRDESDGILLNTKIPRGTVLILK